MTAERSIGGKDNGMARASWGVIVLVLLVVVLFRPVAQAIKPVPDGVKILLWHSQRGEERDTLEVLLRRFNALPENAGKVYVEPLGVPDASFKDKLVRNIPRGSGPDLFVRPHNELGELHGERVVGEVNPADLPFPAAHYASKLLDGFSIDGHLYGYPLTYKGLFLFYNTKLNPSGPPRDVRDLVALRSTLPAGTFPLVYDATSLYFHSPFFIGAGGSVFGPDGRTFAIFQEPAATSFDWPGAWKRSGVMPPEPNYNEMVRLFQAGQAAAIICGPWYRPGGAIGASGEWAVAPIPAVNGRPTGSFVTVEGVYLSARSRHPQEAAKVAAFLAGPAGEAERFDRLSLPPVSQAGYARLDALTPSDPQQRRRLEIVRVQRASLENGLVTPNSERMGAVWTPAMDLLQASLAGRDFAKALEDSRYTLARVDEARPARVDWRPYGAVLAALLGLGTWLLVARLRKQTAGHEAARARLTGFSTGAALPYLLPGLSAVIILVFVPLIIGAGMSLYEHEHGSFTFVGLDNFHKILLPPMARLFQARSFYFALAVTVLWTLTNVVAHISLGIFTALLLRPSWNRLRTVYRLVLILPWAIPNYITALMWKGMFNAQVGAVNVLLAPFGFTGFNWFDRFHTAFIANLVTNTWLGFPFMMVVTLGALQSIPSEVEEAAMLDGASRWQRFRYIVLPYIRPALLPSVILGSVWTFNMFNIIYLVSGGEPGSQTDILISEAYRWAFERGQRFGYAAAYSVLIFLFLLLYSRITSRLQKPEGT